MHANDIELHRIAAADRIELLREAAVRDPRRRPSLRSRAGLRLVLLGLRLAPETGFELRGRPA